jgi:hypothetical protein
MLGRTNILILTDSTAAMIAYLTKSSHFATSRPGWDPITQSRWELLPHKHRDSHGRSAFLAACAVKDKDISSCLNLMWDNPMWRGVDRADNKYYDNDGMFAVHLAMQAQNMSTLKWLWGRGFDFGVKTANGDRFTVAHIAVMGRYQDGLDFLLQPGVGREVLLMGGGPGGGTTPLKLCLDCYKNSSQLYAFMYYRLRLGIDEPGRPVPNLVLPWRVPQLEL